MSSKQHTSRVARNVATSAKKLNMNLDNYNEEDGEFFLGIPKSPSTKRFMTFLYPKLTFHYKKN